MNGSSLMDGGLRDIRGLDAVSVWPLAPGWWLLIIALIVAAIALFLLSKAPIAALFSSGDWRGDARHLLGDLKRRLPSLDGRSAASEFSELMRRIAMARTARDECAGLSGADWLDWLSANDPGGFDWREHGRLIIEAPYAPIGTSLNMDDMGRLIDAAANWLAPPTDEGVHTDPSVHREAA